MTDICPTVQVLVGGVWEDLTEEARSEPPRVTRGRNDESSRTTPTTVTLRLQNRDGRLTPGNPESPWFGQWGRGTLLRLRVPTDDTHLFVSGEFGGGARTADHSSLDITGDIHVRVPPLWLSGIPAQGVTLASKYDGDGQASWWFHLTPEGRLELAWSPDGTLASLQAPESLAVVSLPTAGRMGFGAYLDVSNAGNHVITYETTTDGVTWSVLSSQTRSGTTSIANTTAPLRVQANLYGARFESFQLRNGILGTQVANPDFGAQTVGTRSFTDAAGRPWVLTGDAEITNERVRFCGEITSIEPDWPKATAPDDPVDAGVAHVAIEATGVLKRMSQGNKALRSPLYRVTVGQQDLTRVLAYWPMEDGSEAVSASSPLEGVQPMTVGGDLRFSGDDTLPGSDSLANVSGGQGFGWYARVPAPVGTLTDWAVDFFFKVPTLETAPASTVLSFVDATGTGRQWRIALSSTELRLVVINAAGDTIVDASSTGVATNWTGDWTQIRLAVTRDGSNVDWSLLAGMPQTGYTGAAGTFAGTVGRPVAIRALDTAPPDGLSVGHITVTTGLATAWFASAERGWETEPAGERIIRLAGEEGEVLTVVGDPAATTPMGVQRSGSFMGLLEECADSDMGILHEQREVCGLRYRTRTSLYNQTPVLELDTDVKDLSRQFSPVANDQRARNDVTVQRTGGSEARLVDQASINAIGLYDEQVTRSLANDALPVYHAGWRLHLGTWPGLRLPRLSMQLNRTPDRIAAWLDADLGDRLTATNLPRQFGRDADQLIEQYEERWDPPRWPVDLTVSPAEPWDVGVLDDPERGRADTAGSSVAAGAADNSTTASTSHVAPSVYAPSTNCLLICAWQSFDNNGNYTLPGSMTAGPAETDGADFSTLRTGYQQLAASGATGTRTATLSVSDRWSACSALIRGAAGNPVIEQTLSGVGSNADVSLTTADDTEAGWWLVAIHGWDLDRDGRMPTLTGCTLVADSGQSPPVSPSASRTRVWVRKVLHSGPQTVTFPVLDDTDENNDNHASLYVVSGVSSIFVAAADTTLPVATPFGPLWITTAGFPTEFPFDISLGGSPAGERGERCTVTAITGTESPQTFTVTRAVNGLALDHPVGADVRLWTPMRAAY